MIKKKQQPAPSAQQPSKKGAKQQGVKKTSSTTKAKSTASATAAKKPGAKKPGAKKPGAKKPAAKKPAAKKPAAKKPAAQKPAAQKPGAQKPAALADNAARVDDGPIALPARKLATMLAPVSAAAVATLVPVSQEDDEDDALDAGLGAAFDGLFSGSPARLAKAAAPFVAGDPAEDLAQMCAAVATDKKAEDVVILRVAELTSYADFFVIAAAPSERQVQAIARAIADELKQRGRISMSTDGMDQGNWVIVDYGSVVVHVFLQSARRYYDLDGFWVDAPRVAVDEGRGQGALQAL